MAEDLGLRRGLGVAIFAVAAGLAISAEAAPLGLSTEAPASPDLLYCVAAVWALRAPGAVPIVVVFTIGLMRDFLTDLPVGLGALTLVFAVEWLKGRRGPLARQPFLAEWLTVVAGAMAIALALWLALVLSLARPPTIAVLAGHVLATALVYPLVAGLLGWIMPARLAKADAMRAGEGA